MWYLPYRGRGTEDSYEELVSSSLCNLGLANLERVAKSCKEKAHSDNSDFSIVDPFCLPRGSVPGGALQVEIRKQLGPAFQVNVNVILPRKS